MVSRIRNQIATARPPMIPASVPSLMVEWELSSIVASGAAPRISDVSRYAPHIVFGKSRAQDMTGCLSAAPSRRVRRGLHLSAKRDIAEARLDLRMTSPEVQPHRSDTQQVHHQCGPPGEALPGHPVQRQ